MCKKLRSSANGMDEADESPDEPPDESLDGTRIEAIFSTSSRQDQPGHSGAEGPTTTPGWTKRISTRGKAARTIVIALVVIAALVALLPHPPFPLPPGIARLLTPVPTQTPQPGAFTTGQMEQVPGLQVQAAYFYFPVPSLSDPNTAYICLFLESTNPGEGAARSTVVALWLTRDAGHTWRQAPLPTITGNSCAVSPARDGSHRVTLSVDNSALDQNTHPCAHSQYLVSEDDGVTWRRIQHASIAPATADSGGCELWSTSRHFFMLSYSNSGLGRSFLERSDDGLTWQRADRGLVELDANWYPQLLDASGETLGALVGAKPELWITRDAGTSWRRIGPIARDTTGIGTVGDLFSEGSLGSWPQLCRCVYAVSYPGSMGKSVGRHVYVSRDDTHWSPLPPIPVKGTSATRSGVDDILGATADGRLLALGAEPSVGAPATPDRSGMVSGPPPRLWAWDTHTGRWELGETRLPCQDLQTCHLFASSAPVVVQADGALRGTVFWLTRANGAGENQTDAQTYYRLFIPAN